MLTSTSQLTAPDLVKSQALVEVEGAMQPECVIYSKAEVFEFNQFIWAFGYVWLGIQFTHTDQGIMQKFVLDWDVMKTWPPVLWGVFFGLIVLIVALSKVLIHVYIGSQVVWLYAIWGVLFFTWFFFKSYTSKNMHIHHYVLSMVVVTFIGYQNKFLSLVQAVLSGIMTEGLSRWSVAPVWDYYIDTNGHYIDDPTAQRSKRMARELRQAKMREAN